MKTQGKICLISMTLEHQRTQEYTGSDRKAYVKKFAKLGEF
jgi:hypothetical protein